MTNGQQIENFLHTLFKAWAFRVYDGRTVFVYVHRGNVQLEKRHDGAYVVSSLINGYLVTRVYIGFTKREAISYFKNHLRKG